MSGLLLDTHIWIWYLAGSPHLPETLKTAIDRAHGDVWLSPISLWETAVLHRRGRIRLTVPVREWVRTALDSLPTHEAPLNHEVALLSEELELGHADPGDRFLAASALVDELTLVTMDGRLTVPEWLPTLTA